MTYPFHELDRGNERVGQLRDLDLADAATLVWAVSATNVVQSSQLSLTSLKSVFSSSSVTPAGSSATNTVQFSRSLKEKRVLSNGEVRRDQGNAPLQLPLFL